jgi:hypothetical protein
VCEYFCDSLAFCNSFARHGISPPNIKQNKHAEKLSP